MINHKENCDCFECKLPKFLNSSNSKTGLLDDDYVPPYTPPKPKRYERQTALSQQARDEQLNNFDREIEDENYKQPSN